MFNIAVFVSGRGSNLESILKYFSESSISVKAVISNKPKCYAVEIAAKNNIECFFVGKSETPNFIDFSRLAEKLVDLKIDLIVLAGYLKKIPAGFIEQFENKIINIHPALLPSFGGKGMYGANVHQAVFNSSAQVSGATVHFVNSIYDEGKIIAQRVVDISKVSSP
jgi:phosphoribosylglycinamide formyltransferase-1